MEAVVTAEFRAGRPHAVQARLHERYEVNLLAVSRGGQRITQRLRSVKLSAGDVIVLQGNLDDHAGDARRTAAAAARRARSRASAAGGAACCRSIVLAAAMLLVALDVVPVAVAFFGAAVIDAADPRADAARGLRGGRMADPGHARRADPGVSDALRTTGGTDLIAGWLAAIAHALPPLGALALIMVAAMAVTPFLNNAATVLVMAPIAASFAKSSATAPTRS